MRSALISFRPKNGECTRVCIYTVVQCKMFCVVGRGPMPISDRSTKCVVYQGARRGVPGGGGGAGHHRGGARAARLLAPAAARAVPPRAVPPGRAPRRGRLAAPGRAAAVPARRRAAAARRAAPHPAAAHAGSCARSPLNFFVSTDSFTSIIIDGVWLQTQ